MLRATCAAFTGSTYSRIYSAVSCFRWADPPARADAWPSSWSSRKYRVWLEALPESLQESATADALRAITEIDLSELESVEPPRGCGRDGTNAVLGPPSIDTPLFLG